MPSRPTKKAPKYHMPKAAAGRLRKPLTAAKPKGAGTLHAKAAGGQFRKRLALWWLPQIGFLLVNQHNCRKHWPSRGNCVGMRCLRKGELGFLLQVLHNFLLGGFYVHIYNGYQFIAPVFPGNDFEA